MVLNRACGLSLGERGMVRLLGAGACRACSAALVAIPDVPDLTMGAELSIWRRSSGVLRRLPALFGSHFIPVRRATRVEPAIALRNE